MMLVVFDLDDTLYPEMQYVRSGFAAAAAALDREVQGHIEGFAEVCLELVASEHRGRVFDEALRRFGVSESLVRLLVDAYRGHRPLIRFRPGIRNLLVALRQAGPVAVLTDGYADVQKCKVEALNLPAMVDRVVLTDAFGRDAWKPSPACFELLQDAFSVLPGHATYVGDNPFKDFVAPNRLGWDTVRLRVPDQLHHDADLEGDYRAHHEVTSVRDLADYLSTAVRRTLR